MQHLMQHGANKMKFNFMKIKGNVFRHRQIERRDGLFFMRMKQRGLIIMRRMKNDSTG